MEGRIVCRSEMYTLGNADKTINSEIGQAVNER